MFLKKIKPSTNGSRNKKLIYLKKRLKFKPLIYTLRSKNGRGIDGKIIARYKWTGLKKKYRLIDYYNVKYNFSYNLVGYELTRYTNSLLGLMQSKNNFKRYVILPDNFNEKNYMITTFQFFNKDESLGHTIPIGWIPNNTLIYNLETKPNQGAKLIRAAGTYGKIITHTNNYVYIKLPSKKLIKVSKYCFASIGRVSNTFAKFQRLGSAGMSYKLGVRPKTLGESMNATDHPNGGRTRKGKPTKNFWGKIVK